VALTPESREYFASSCVTFMEQYGFDGIDIDWEYPVDGGLETNAARPEDRGNYTLLLAEIRRQLDELGAQNDRHYLLTIAAPAGASNYRNYELGSIAEYLDWINIMAFDYSGGWSTETGFNAPLFADNGNPGADDAVRAYLDAGVPAAKLTLGIPFYGRGWKGVSEENGGLYQPFTSLPNPDDGGAFSYGLLTDVYIRAGERYWSDAAQVPWLYIGATQTMISYDDPESMTVKANYVKSNGLGGAMFWELRHDNGTHDLLNALYDGLLTPQAD